jgi:hypothetical protein
MRSSMSVRIIPIADGFWNIRGPFKSGPLQVGSHCSLARLSDGGFVLLSSYAPSDEVLSEIHRITNDGADIRAILNLHPFHTVHVKRVHALFPKAKLHGTDRHVEKAPELPWQDERTTDPALHKRFSDDLWLSVPRGVEFVASDPRLHFSSVVAIHRPSRTLHVDDTLVHNPLPLVGGVIFHPTLAKVLEKRPGAAAEFRAWAESLIEACGAVEHLCTAHMPALPKLRGSVQQTIRSALERVDKTLVRHERRWG